MPALPGRCSSVTRFDAMAPSKLIYGLDGTLLGGESVYLFLDPLREFLWPNSGCCSNCCVSDV